MVLASSKGPEHPIKKNLNNLFFSRAQRALNVAFQRARDDFQGPRGPRARLIQNTGHAYICKSLLYHLFILNVEYHHILHVCIL